MLIALEGIDGSGKATQVALLEKALRRQGFTVGVISFPRYGKTLFSGSIADYLNGKLGNLSTVNPLFAALLYAGDRFESRQDLYQLDQTCDVVLVDRYVASNLAYQSAKIAAKERMEFIEHLCAIEHDVYGLPKAELTVYLDIDAESALNLVRKKSERSYTDQALDIHERDIPYLAKCRDVYQMLARMNIASEWRVVDCVGPTGLVRPKAEIQTLVLQAVYPFLETVRREAAGAEPLRRFIGGR